MPRGAPNPPRVVAAVKQELLAGATYRAASAQTGVPFGTVAAIGNRMVRAGEMIPRGRLSGPQPSSGQRAWA